MIILLICHLIKIYFDNCSIFRNSTRFVSSSTTCACRSNYSTSWMKAKIPSSTLNKSSKGLCRKIKRSVFKSNHGYNYCSAQKVNLSLFWNLFSGKRQSGDLQEVPRDAAEGVGQGNSWRYAQISTGQKIFFFFKFTKSKNQQLMNYIKL